MSGVISRFLITPRVFALFKSGLSLRCVPLLPLLSPFSVPLCLPLLFPLQLPLLLEHCSARLLADLENLKALRLCDSGPSAGESIGVTEQLQHQRLLRIYKPYTLFEQVVRCRDCLRLHERYAREICALQPVVL
jgi:hypothetical protein